MDGYTKLERIKTISSPDDEEVIEAAVLPPWAIYGLGELNEHTLILLRAFKEAYCKDCEYSGCSCTNENFCIGKWGKECTECSTCEHKKIAYIDDIKICVNRGYINCPLENKECEFCQPRRDDNEDLIYSELNGECNYFTQIRYKGGEYRLYTVNSFRRINFCPICGRKLE